MKRTFSWATVLFLFPGFACCQTDLNRFTFQTGIRAQYDDNIFEYSDASIQAFDPALSEFKGLVSVDDFILEPFLWANIQFKQGLFDRLTRFSLGFQPRFYLSNKVKNEQVYTAHFLQHLPGRFRVGLQYSLVPRYYVRPLATPPNQLSTYADAFFQWQTIRLNIDKAFSRKWMGRIWVYYEYKDYNPTFNERSIAVWGGGPELTLSLRKDIQALFDLNYERGIARGQNDAVKNSDTSYFQWSFRLEPTFKIAAGLHLVPRYSFSYRHFTSALSTDLYHFGREDVTHQEELVLRGRLAKGFEGQAGYERTDRISTGNGSTLAFTGFGDDRVFAELSYHF